MVRFVGRHRTTSITGHGLTVGRLSVVDVIRCLVERCDAVDRLIRIMPARFLTVELHFDLNVVRVDTDDPAGQVLAGNAYVIAKFELGR